jgi:1-deoxy-D-xylulose-5-phosphate reductoisomerase
VVIHPQSILHSAVEFVDSSVVGQFGLPDMHLPIHYALFWPDRRACLQVRELNLVEVGTLTFEEPDRQRFPCLALAEAVALTSDTSACVLNAANEIVVTAVLERRIAFHRIPELVQRVLELHKPVWDPDLEDILEADRWARQAALQLTGCDP